MSRKNNAILSIVLSSILILLMLCSIAMIGCAKENKDTTKAEVGYSMKLPDIVKEVGEDSFVDYTSFTQQSLTSGANLDGIIVCPYYNVRVMYANGTKSSVFSYSVPTVNSEIHSFGYIEATADMLPLTVTIEAQYNVSSAFVIPEKFGITPVVDDNKVSFAVKSFDDYNVLFNGKFNFSLPYTVFVREYETIDVPHGYNLIEYKAGIHYVDYVDIESNTMVYLHSGAYLIAKQPDLYTEQNSINTQGNHQWKAFFRAENKENIIIKGCGVVDFSNLDLHARHPLQMTGCTNVKVSGVTFINGPLWQMHFVDCKYVTVENVKLFGYRINSDGIAVCNSKKVRVQNCWIRSGDDLFEVKATKSSAPNSQTGGESIVFRHNQAWAEKTRSFGFIQESLMDVDGVLFEDCSSLLQVATMYDAMGAFLVIVGDTSTVKNVTFKNCDSYYCQGFVMNVAVGPNFWSEGDYWGRIENITFSGISYYNDFSNYDVVLAQDIVLSNNTQGVNISNKDMRANGTGQLGSSENVKNIVFENIVQDGVRIDDLESLPIVMTGVDATTNKIRLR